jgi:hypothetical protein
MIPGPIIAEFVNGTDARDFCIAKGLTKFTVTPGINHPFAVRPFSYAVRAVDEVSESHND